VEKFCKGVKPGQGAIMQCLKQHEAELSAECKAKGAEIKKDVSGIAEACRSDAQTLCKGVEPGGGRIAKCLKENDAKLSPACKEKLAEGKTKGDMLKKKIGDAMQNCKADAEKFCKDVKPGGGRIMKCLKEHEAELSEGCKNSRK
jgi:hypothetical protein